MSMRHEEIITEFWVFFITEFLNIDSSYLNWLFSNAAL